MYQLANFEYNKWKKKLDKKKYIYIYIFFFFNFKENISITRKERVMLEIQTFYKKFYKLLM